MAPRQFFFSSCNGTSLAVSEEPSSWRTQRTCTQNQGDPISSSHPRVITVIKNNNNNKKKSILIFFLVESLRKRQAGLAATSQVQQGPLTGGLDSRTARPLEGEVKPPMDRPILSRPPPPPPDFLSAFSPQLPRRDAADSARLTARPFGEGPARQTRLFPPEAPPLAEDPTNHVEASRKRLFFFSSLLFPMPSLRSSAPTAPPTSFLRLLIDRPRAGPGGSCGAGAERGRELSLRAGSRGSSQRSPRRGCAVPGRLLIPLWRGRRYFY